MLKKGDVWKAPKRPLGARPPTDKRHVERYPLSAAPDALVAPTVPVVIGIDWYSNFDSPVWDGVRWWVGRGSLGFVRGGHCVCVKDTHTDSDAWWEFYDQGSEGACVGFGTARAMTLLNRQRYDARWTWQQARLIDEWTDNDDLSDPDQGTSVRAGLEVIRTRGERRIYRGVEYPEDPATGISAYRWVTTFDEVVAVTNMDIYNRLGAVSFLNSWGTGYPRRVWMPAETFQKLLDDGGDAGVPTDR